MDPPAARRNAPLIGIFPALLMKQEVVSMPQSLFLPVLMGLMTLGHLSYAADSGAPAKPPYPRNDVQDLHLTVNLTAPNLVLEWPDGRRAESRVSISKPFSSTARMTVSENECFPQAAPPKCRITASGAILYTGIVWVRHPDATRLGKPVEYDLNYQPPGAAQTGDSQSVGSQVEGKFSQNLFISEFVNPEKLKPIFAIPTDSLTCDSYEWLTGSKGAPVSVEIPSICDGDMGKNLETGINENNFRSCTEFVHFQTDANRSLVLKAIGAQQQQTIDLNAFGPSGPIGNVSSWEQSTANRVCQITTTLQDPPNFNELLKLFTLIPTAWEPAQPIITKELQDRLEIMPQHPFLNHQDRSGFTGVFK